VYQTLAEGLVLVWLSLTISEHASAEWELYFNMSPVH
jgi:hypothetical protein